MYSPRRGLLPRHLVAANLDCAEGFLHTLDEARIQVEQLLLAIPGE